MSRAWPVFLMTMLLICTNQKQADAEPERFEIARPGYTFVFPRDHGSHPSYEIEWWYFTGNLRSEKDKPYGYELTFFRKGVKNRWADENPSRWVVRDIYLAHFAITDIAGKKFHYEEKISRKAMGKAGAEIGKMSVWIDHWQVVQAGEDIHLKAGRGDWAIDLTLRPGKAIVIHGEEGISRKGEAESAASHYYSMTRLKTAGQFTVAGEMFSLSGLSWMDHEFSSSLLDEGLIGWDWFSIQLEDGSDYMFYQLRRSDGTQDPASSGTVIAPDGKTRHLSSEDFSLTPLTYWKSKKSGANYPLGWEISIPSEALLLTSEPAMNDQELITSKSTRLTYWEGASRFTGTKNEKAIAGAGYVELTGYAEDIKLPELQGRP